MTSIVIGKDRINLIESERYVAGTSAVYIMKVSFSEDWAGLEKHLIFRTDNFDISVDILRQSEQFPIPSQILAQPITKLQIGAYGSSCGQKVLNTRWLSLGRVVSGTIDGGCCCNMPSIPTPDTYKILKAEIDRKADRLTIEDEQIKLWAGSELLSSADVPTGGINEDELDAKVEAAIGEVIDTKVDQKIDEALGSNLDSKVESIVDNKMDSKLESVKSEIEKDLTFKTESIIDTKVKTEVDSAKTEIESTINSTVTSTVDSKLEATKSEIESTIDSKIESKFDSELEEKVAPIIDSKVESKLDSELEDKVRPIVESELDSKLEEKVGPIVESKVESELDSKLEEKLGPIVDSKLGEEVGPLVKSEVDKALSENLSESVGEIVNSKVKEALGDQLDDKVEEVVSSKIDSVLDEKVQDKADKSYVDQQLGTKANISDVDEKLELKADKTYVDQQLETKADKSYTDEKLGEKADKSYVDEKLEDKADTSYVNAQLSDKVDASYVSAQIADKADTSYVNSQLSDKASTSYVDDQLSNKVDKELGKGLSERDFTSVYEEKLNGLKNYELPIASSTLGGVRMEAGKAVTIDGGGAMDVDWSKIPTDGTLSAEGGTLKVDKIDWTQVDGKPDLVRKEDLVTVYRYQGSVATYSELPTGLTSEDKGHVYNVIDSGLNYAWVGIGEVGTDDKGWDSLGGSFKIETITDEEIDQLFEELELA